MTLEEIIAAVEAGKKVHWASTSYTVIAHTAVPGKFLIQCDNGYCVGLTNGKGELRENADQFFLGREPHPMGGGHAIPSANSFNLTGWECIG